MGDYQPKAAWDARQQYADLLSRLIEGFCISMARNDYNNAMNIVRNYYTVTESRVEEKFSPELIKKIAICQRNVDRLRNSTSDEGVRRLLREDLHITFQKLLDNTKHLIMPVETKKTLELTEEDFFS